VGVGVGVVISFFFVIDNQDRKDKGNDKRSSLFALTISDKRKFNKRNGSLRK
jgi:hypothetical protein